MGLLYGVLWGLHKGAIIIRIRFWGPLYYYDNKEPPKLYW